MNYIFTSVRRFRDYHMHIPTLLDALASTMNQQSQIDEVSMHLD